MNERSITRLAAEAGVSYTTMWKRLHPERAKEMDRQSNDRRGSARWYRPCPKCGERMTWHRDIKQCAACKAAHEQDRRELAERLWRDGLSTKEIAATMGWKSKQPNVYIARLRKLGWDFPLRQPRRKKTA